jgi:predicted DNA-binding transcriptional regulator YafY
MSNPASRVLAVLELLQVTAPMNGPELARRAGVDRRTVRRYIAQLVQMGVPIEGRRGPDGGYSLMPGYKLPPMMFSAEETLALAVGLRAAGGLGLSGITPAIASTQAKLERVMPKEVRRRLRDIDETVSLEFARPYALGGSATLLGLSAAARTQQRVRIDHLSADQREIRRDVDVYGLAYRGGAWYAVGYCHLRRALRSFRLDRITRVEALPVSFGRPPGFDVLAYLTRSIASLPRAHAIDLMLHTDLATAQRAVYKDLGELEAGKRGVRLRAQVDNLSWLARELARLPFGFTIRKPAGLRQALAAHAQTMMDCAERGSRRG